MAEIPIDETAWSLRVLAKSVFNGPAASLCNDAADEIEHLREMIAAQDALLEYLDHGGKNLDELKDIIHNKEAE